MKKQKTITVKRAIALLFISSLSLCPSYFIHAAGCSGDSGACSAGGQKLSPFIAASLRESVPPHIEGPVKRSAAPTILVSAAAASPVFSGVPPEAGGRLSSPAWLILMLAGFAWLYFYLRGGDKKNRRK